MFTADNLGRVYLDNDSFIAPFGYYGEDYKFVVNYLRDPEVSKRVYHDNFGENELLWNYAEYLKHGIGWIGFYKKKRGGFIFLELVTRKPLIYAIHGGYNRELYGKNIGKMTMQFAKFWVFEVAKAHKLEGYILKPNNLIKGYYKYGGLQEECRMKDRILIDGKPSPIIIHGLTNEDYFMEKEHGRRRRKTSSTRSEGADQDADRSPKTRKRKTRKRKRRKGR